MDLLNKSETAIGIDAQQARDQEPNGPHDYEDYCYPNRAAYGTQGAAANDGHYSPIPRSPPETPSASLIPKGQSLKHSLHHTPSGRSLRRKHEFAAVSGGPTDSYPSAQGSLASETTSGLPQSTQEAQLHIERIRAQKLNTYGKDEAGDMEAALKLISGDLYQNPMHFLLELLQNADDSVYENPQPMMKITYDNGTIRFDTNEVGFRRRDVEAICSVGNSFKQESGQGRRRIGEKGIGFKSVFRIAEAAYITSGYYSFKFTTEERIGMLVPICSPFPRETIPGFTSIFLQLNPKVDVNQLIEELRALDGRILMFLQNLKQVLVRIAEADGSVTEIMLRQKSHYPTVSSGSELCSIEPDGLSPYLIFRHSVPNLPMEEKRKDWHDSEIVLAFPMGLWDSTSLVRLRRPNSVYSFLPIRDYGFEFVLHADFILVPSREDIDQESEWNRCLRQQIPVAFLHSITELRHSNLRYLWPYYVPSKPKIENFFQNVWLETLALLSQSPILESVHGAFLKPSELCLVPKELAGPNGQPLIPADVSKLTYISSNYPTEVWYALESLGVRILSADDFLEDLHSFIRGWPEKFQSMAEEWHSCLARVLDPLVNDYEERIMALSFVHLRNGTLASPKSGLLFSVTTENMTVPEEINASVVKVDTDKDHSRRILLQKLGAQTPDNASVCRIILETHKSEDFNPESAQISSLIRHVEFLCSAGWSSESSDDRIWLVAEDESRHHGCSLYLSSDDPYSAMQILSRCNSGISLRKHFLFLNSGYSSKFPNPEDRKWLQNSLGLSEAPRLVYRSHPSTKYIVDPGLKPLRNQLHAQDFLQMLKANWTHYRQWVVSENPPNADIPRQPSTTANPVNESQDGEKSPILKEKATADALLRQEIRSIFSELDVECWDGKAKLSRTCLPRKKVLQDLNITNTGTASQTRLSGDNASETPRLPQPTITRIKTCLQVSNALFPVLEIPEPEDPGWDILKHFGVIINVTARELILRLESLQERAISSRIRRIYRQIQACAVSDDVDFLHLVPVSKSDRLSVINQLRSVQVLEVESVRVTWKVTNTGGDIFQGNPEKGRAMLATDDNQLKIYMTKDNMKIGCPPLELIDELSAFCGIDTNEHVRLLGHILIQDDIERIEVDLDRRIKYTKGRIKTPPGRSSYCNSAEAHKDAGHTVPILETKAEPEAIATSPVLASQAKSGRQRLEGGWRSKIYGKNVSFEDDAVHLSKERHMGKSEKSEVKHPKSIGKQTQSWGSSDNNEGKKTAGVTKSSSRLVARSKIGPSHHDRDTSPQEPDRLKKPRNRTPGLISLSVPVLSASRYRQIEEIKFTAELYARLLSQAKGATTERTEVFVLAYVYNILDNPEVALYPDPWDLYASGLLSLEAFNDQQGRLDDTTPAVHMHALTKVGDDDEPLRGVIRHVPISHVGTFQALSYVWGGYPSEINPYYLHTQQGNVLLNFSLYSALRALRKGSIISVWADGVCINQKNPREKALQISMLGKIFQAADQVTGWLGHAYNGSEDAMRVLSQIHTGSHSLFRNGNSAESAERTGRLPCMVPDSGDVAWKYINSLLRRPWFARVWITQELVLPPKVVLKCGQSELDWDQFFGALTVCERESNRVSRQSPDDIRLLPDAGPAYAPGLARYRQKKEGKRYGLLKWFELFEHAEASMEVDKLFAFLGLAHDGDGEEFVPDYESTLEKVVRRYSKGFILRGKVMELLYRAGGTKSYDFCSWIPRWTVGEFPKTISTWDAHGGPFRAGMPSAPLVDTTGGQVPQCLSVDGYVVDTIHSTHSIKWGSGSSLFFFDAMVNFKSVLSFVSEYPTGESKDDLLLQLPIGSAARPHLESHLDKERAYRAFAAQENNEWPLNLRELILSVDKDQTLPGTFTCRTKPRQLLRSIGKQQLRSRNDLEMLCSASLKADSSGLCRRRLWRGIRSACFMEATCHLWLSSALS
ncbi:hypothetical protein NUW58_g2132 [Xylaria curta]|uniref:Uncharacterized protein n=1 Tax=Xylaria curta TaxID=42375 RepID=A0ACC1PI86_9PEZI|nr:hypothetical protein NUW58_g2132 [Xylaria curta]